MKTARTSTPANDRKRPAWPATLSRIAVLAGALVASGTATATGPTTEPPAVPVTVVEVTTGGFWKTGDDRGRYRVIVEAQGWEHVTSRVFLQWIAERPSEKKLVVVASVPLSELPGNAAVGAPRLVPGKSGTSLRLEATDSLTGKRRSLVFALAEPGKYQLKR